MAASRRQTSDAENNGDRETPQNPNAMGPTMRSPYAVYASTASGLCDEHDAEPLKILGSSKIQRMYK